MGAFAVIVLGGVGYSIFKNARIKNESQETSQSAPKQGGNSQQGGIDQNQTPSPNPSPTTKNSPTPTPTTKNTPTPKPTTRATPTTSPSSYSCPYNLSVATGAVKVNLRAQSGVLVGDQVVELQANSGCSVLVNKSTDKDTRIARQGSPVVDFSQVPPGPYRVRVKYKDQWTGYQVVDVSSGQQATITITVSGDTPSNTPTPTPKPRPTCYNPVVYPSTTGTAPFQVTLQPQGDAGSTGGIQGYEWDFTGDGSWDTGASPDAQVYTYQNPGTYTVKNACFGG